MKRSGRRLNANEQKNLESEKMKEGVVHIIKKRAIKGL